MGLSRNRGQTTLKERVRLSGVGVHSGAEVSVVLNPADPNSGISFLRASDSGDIEIPARSSAVGATALCTVLGDPKGVHVATVEHLLAALAGLGVDNCLIEIDGAEVPVMDGSSRAFVEAIDQAGLVVQSAPKRVLRIDKPVRIEQGEAFAEFLPHDGCRFEISIDYDCEIIGRQAYTFDLSADGFRRDIAGARTYGYLSEVEALWAAGFARGSSLDNAVVIGDGIVVNPEGLRYPDEFVRHKVLDTIGDLSLAGAPIQGLFRSYKGGHRLNAAALAALLAESGAWTLRTAADERETRPAGRVEPAAGLAAAAYAPEVR